MMNLFTKSLARNVDTANRRQVLPLPRRQSAIKDRDILVAEFSERMGSERCPTFTFVVHNNRNPPVRHQFGNAKFDLAPRQRSRVGNLTSIELAALTNIEYGVQRFRSHPTCQIATPNLVSDTEDPPLLKLNLTHPWFCSTNASR